jgi:hypothetical protein
VKYDFLLLPSRTTKISNAGLLFVVIFSFIYSGVIALGLVGLFSSLV